MLTKEFYYLEGNEQKGPMGIDQLKTVGLKSETLVWTEGLDDWKPAKEVEELKILIMKTPPPPTISSTPKQGSVEEEYEKTITLYLKNDYQIVSQSADTTIMLSPKFQKRAGFTSFANAMAGGPAQSMAASANVQRQQAKFQVTIRITKTGQLQVIGYTLDQSQSGCFVATAVYGSYEHPSVMVLRNFRDTRLATNSAGRQFISAYYQHGPRLARAITPHPLIRKCIRVLLECFVVILR